MPPTHTEEGLDAAREIRARHPRDGDLILSQHVEVGIAMRVLVESPERLGYLLKDRVTDLEDFAAHAAPRGRRRLGARPADRLAAARRPARRGPAERRSRRASARCSS